MDLEQLLKENEILEKKIEEQERKMIEIKSHQETIVASICGTDIQYYFPPRIIDNLIDDPLRTGSFKNLPAFILNRPEERTQGELMARRNEIMIKNGCMDPINKESEFLNSLLSYRCIRVYRRNRYTKHSHEFDFYTTVIFKWEGSAVIEISDSEGNIFRGFVEFKRAIDPNWKSGAPRVHFEEYVDEMKEWLNLV